jgi:hypothetical protein
VGDEEGTNVEVFGTLNDGPVLRLLESLKGELLRGRQVGTEESGKVGIDD